MCGNPFKAKTYKRIGNFFTGAFKPPKIPKALKPPPVPDRKTQAGARSLSSQGGRARRSSSAEQLRAGSSINTAPAVLRAGRIADLTTGLRIG